MDTTPCCGPSATTMFMSSGQSGEFSYLLSGRLQEFLYDDQVMMSSCNGSNGSTIDQLNGTTVDIVHILPTIKSFHTIRWRSNYPNYR